MTHPYETYVHNYEVTPTDLDEWQEAVASHLSVDHQWPAAPIEDAEGIHDSLHDEDETR